MDAHTLDSDSKPKSRPRLFRWSLRRFLIFFTLVSISSGWWITRAQKQRAAVAKIQELGGDVVYSSSISTEWLSDLIGVDYVQTVTKVRFAGIYKNMESLDVKKVSNAVKQLSSCRSLSMELSNLTNLQLSELQPLSGQLEEIRLRECFSEHLVADGIKVFQSWPKLKSFSYSCTTDNLDLSKLSTCPRLEAVDFGCLHLSKENFQHLARCKNLKTISFYACSFEGEFLSELNTPALKLKTLSLVNCNLVPAIGSKDWKSSPPEPTFNFRGGDPQMYMPYGDSEFPSEAYEAWKKKILPGVDIIEGFIT